MMMDPMVPSLYVLHGTPLVLTIKIPRLVEVTVVPCVSFYPSSDDVFSIDLHDALILGFSPEAKHAANNGLVIARNLMERVHKNHPEISYGDLWTLAGVCAIQELVFV